MIKIIVITMLFFLSCHGAQETAGLKQADTTSPTGSTTKTAGPVRLILDTDLETDVDDVGSIALLHSLADRKEVEILAMMISGKNPYSPLCLDALNTYYSRGDIPIGINKGDGVMKKSKYAAAIAREFKHDVPDGQPLLNAVDLYRKILSRQSQSSVVIVSIGYLTNLRRLLESRGDKYSPLNGIELVKKKVRHWVCMGGKIPSGRGHNLGWDGKSAAYAIDNWPGPITFSAWEIGKKIMTGAALKKASIDNPVRRSYELYNGLRNRASWDQTAILYAVRCLDNSKQDYWTVVHKGYNHIFENGANEWRKEPDKDHSYLVEKKAPAKIAKELDRLMLHEKE